MTKGRSQLPGSPRRGLAPRLILLVMVACGFFATARGASAEPVFGDSSWVAPTAFANGDSSGVRAESPRPDHERLWETALRTPFRIGFFPLRLVARGMEEGVGRYGDRLMNPKPKTPAKGWAIGPAIDVDGVTEVGAGPAITWAGTPDESRLRLSGTWSTIDRRRVRLSGRIADRRPVGFRLRGDYDYKPNLRFYGIGNQSRSADRSIFLFENTGAEGALLLGASPVRQLRLVGGYSAMSARRGYQGQPRLDEVFAPGSLPYQHVATQEWLYGVTGDFAALDDGLDPTVGVHGRGEFRRATGVRDRDPDFNQWLVEGRAYAPLFAKRRVVAFRAAYAGVDPTGSTVTIPFYRLVQSDGPLRFAGYPSHRFQDRQLLLGRIEYRWEVWRHVRAVALYELGEVAPQASAFTARAARWSYGGGFRYGLTEESTARLEVAKSVEGIHAVLSIGSGF
jgi:surface antigen Omp85-like protein